MCSVSECEILIFFQQPHQTTWLVCGVWRLGRSRGNTAAIRRLWCVWPSMTACWAEEEEKRNGKHITVDSLENGTGGILCVGKLEAHVGTGRCTMCGRLIIPTLRFNLIEMI